MDKAAKPNFDHDKLFWHTNLLTVASVIGGGLSAIHQSLMGRMLSFADYGNFVFIFSFINLINVPATTLQTLMVNYVSKWEAAGQNDRIGGFLAFCSRRLFLYAMPLILGLLIFSPQISVKLGLQSAWPVVISAFIIAFMLLTPIGLGVLQGLQRFIAFIIVGTGAVIMRLVAGWALVWAGMGLSGAMAGCLASFIFLALGLFLVLRPFLKKQQETVAGDAITERLSSYFWYVLLANTMCELLMNLDLISVKYVFSDADMGVYAQAGTIARLFAWVTGPVILAMFPKIVHETVENHEVKPLFVRATVFSIVVVAGASLFCSIFPGFIARVLFKVNDETFNSLVRFAVWTFAPFPVFKMMLNFLIARNQFKVLVPLGVICVAYAATLQIWHPQLISVCIVTGCYLLLALIVTLWYCMRELGKSGFAVNR